MHEVLQERRKSVSLDATFWSEPPPLSFGCCVDVPPGGRGCLACSDFRLSAGTAAVSNSCLTRLSPEPLTLPPRGGRKRGVQFSSYTSMSKSKWGKTMLWGLILLNCECLNMSIFISLTWAQVSLRLNLWKMCGSTQYSGICGFSVYLLYNTAWLIVKAYCLSMSLKHQTMYPLYANLGVTPSVIASVIHLWIHRKLYTSFEWMEEGVNTYSFLPLTSSVLVAEVREAPHVAQADDGAGDRQNKLYLVAPLAPLLHLLLRWGQQVFGLAGAIVEACFCSVSCKTERRGGLQQVIEAGRCRLLPVSGVVSHVFNNSEDALEQ